MEPKVHCIVYNSLPLASFLGQSISVHDLSSNLLNINFNIQHLCLGLGCGFFPSGFPTKTLSTPLIFLHTFHMPRPYDFSLFYHTNNTLFYIQSPATPSFLDLILSSATNRRTVFFPQSERQSFPNIQNNRRNYNYLYFNIFSLDNNRQGKIFWTEKWETFP